MRRSGGKIVAAIKYGCKQMLIGAIDANPKARRNSPVRNHAA